MEAVKAQTQAGSSQSARLEGMKPGGAQKEAAPLPNKEGAKNKPNLLLALLLLLSLVGLFLLAKYVVPQVIIYLTKATRSKTYSLTNSYIFGSPLVAPADGQTKIRISAFLLNDQGLGVADKAISLSAEPKDGGTEGNVQIKEVQSVTDGFGKAVFEVVSRSAGRFVVTAMVDGSPFPQTVTLTFK